MVSPVSVVESECVVRGALATVLRWTRYVGLSPLWLRRERNGWRAGASPRWASVGRIFAIIASCSMTLMMVSSLRVLDCLGSVVWQVVLAAGTMASVAASVIMVWTAPRRMACLVATLNTVRQIHLRLHSQPDQMTKMQIAVLIAFLTTNFTVGLKKLLHVAMISTPTLNQAGQATRWFHSLDFLFDGVVAVGVLHFMSLAREARSGFKAVNKSLENLLKAEFSESNSSREQIRVITWAYGSCCDVVCAMDAAHGLTLTAVITVCFLNLIITPYLFIQNLVKVDRSPMFYIYEAVHTMAFCSQLGSLLLVVEPCHSTQADMEVTSELVSRLMQRVPSVHHPLALELEQFCKQILVNQASYSPLNLFCITREFVITIFVSITTYLVIIIDIK